MSALRRFFRATLPPEGETATLEGEEAHHLLNVIRVWLGEEVSLFDGAGREARARLVGARRREAELRILSCEEISREPALRLTLACALPRATRMDWLIEKCVELGVACLVPMIAQRNVVRPGPREAHQQGRWQRAVVEASKQCGRNRLMEITDALPFGAVFARADEGAARLIASTAPEAAPLGSLLNALPAMDGVFALIGPEGGFTPDEVALAAKARCRPVSLGPRILRVETAAVALAARLLLP